MNDHDLLIQLNTKMNSICTVVKNLDEKIDKVQDKVDMIQTNCSCRIEGCTKYFLSKKLWMWVTAFLIAGIIAVAGYSANNHFELGKVQTHIEMQSK